VAPAGISAVALSAAVVAHEQWGLGMAGARACRTAALRLDVAASRPPAWMHGTPLPHGRGHPAAAAAAATTGTPPARGGRGGQSRRGPSHDVQLERVGRGPHQ